MKSIFVYAELLLYCVHESCDGICDTRATFCQVILKRRSLITYIPFFFTLEFSKWGFLPASSPPFHQLLRESSPSTASPYLGRPGTINPPQDRRPPTNKVHRIWKLRPDTPLDTLDSNPIRIVGKRKPIDVPSIGAGSASSGFLPATAKIMLGA